MLRQGAGSTLRETFVCEGKPFFSARAGLLLPRKNVSQGSNRPLIAETHSFSALRQAFVYRELPFMLKTAYNNLFDDRKVDENIFLQGVIDLLILDGDKAVIVDYKYSRNSDYLKNKYGKQLNSYAQAVREILRVDDVEKYILSIADGKLIKM